MTALLPDWRANIFPPMEEAALAELTGDIRDHGQREPIVVFNGKVLDGWHRYQVCGKLGIEPKTREFKGEESDALSFILSANLTRRHLTNAQRAMIADKISTMRQGARTDIANFSPFGERAQADAATLLNVSKRSVERAAKVRKDAPELVDKVKSGELSLSKAATVADRISEGKATNPVRTANREMFMVLKGVIT